MNHDDDGASGQRTDPESCPVVQLDHYRDVRSAAAEPAGAQTPSGAGGAILCW